MKRRSRKDRPVEAPAPTPEPPPTAPSFSLSRPGLRRGFRLAAAVLVPLLGLLLLEVSLRLAGYGYPTRFFVHHPAVRDGALVENQRFPRQFFPPTLARFPEPVHVMPRKPPGTVRIFVFGESAAMGDPAPAFSVARILDVLLRERHPDVRFEVVNVAFTAINSHVIRAIARDCAPLGGDAWVVYMGHNEVIGPFGTGTIFSPQSPPLAVIRASLTLKHTRVGQLLDAALQSLGGLGRHTNGWTGMDMFLEQQVRAGDPRLQRLENHFRRNLDEIIRLGTSSGAQVIVSTLASRLRDWPPFGSLHRAGLSAADLAQWQARFDAGVAAEARGDATNAVRQFAEAAILDAEHAELHYRWGRCSLALGQDADARFHLVRARDLDSLRFRTDTRLNRAIRETVQAHREPHVRLLEAEAQFADRSPHGIPGEEWFHEHVHLTFAGNYLLARLFAEELETALAAKLGHGPPSTPAWPDESACAARLGYTANQEYEVGVLIRRRFGEAIYRSQPGHAERYAALEKRLAELRLQTKPTARRQALQLCRDASARVPDDWVLHDLMARLLMALDDSEGAAAEWRRVTELIPHWAVAYTELGKLARSRQDWNLARSWFTRAIEVNPDCAAAYAGLGTIARHEGQMAEASRLFHKALRLDPSCEEAQPASPGA